MLISKWETHCHRKSYMIKYKQEICLKIEQDFIENNVSVETSYYHYGIRRKYYTSKRYNQICCLMVLCQTCGRFILVHLVHCCQLLMSFYGMPLSYTSKGLFWHLIGYVARLICALTFGENQNGYGKCHFRWLKSHACIKLLAANSSKSKWIESQSLLLTWIRPQFCSRHSKKQEWKGMKSVNICTSMNDTKRATLAVSVCADGS